MLRRELSRLPVEISSAGTHAMLGKPMHEPMQEIAGLLGLSDAELHYARQLSVRMIRESDLVLVMDRGHRRQVVEMLPRASRYTFTIREFARLADQVSADDLAERLGYTAVQLLRNSVESVARLRGTLPLLDNPSQDDVVDPYGQQQATYRLSVKQLVPAANASARLLNEAMGEI